MLREVWPFVRECGHAGLSVVLARLVGRDGNGSRPLGATMAVAADGRWRGSLSGGCVEGMVLDAARGVLGGAPARVLSVMPGEEILPWEEGPACAGELRVLVTPVPPEPVFAAVDRAFTEDRPLALAVGLRPPYRWWCAGWIGALPVVEERFVEELRPRRRLVMVGATDLAAALAGFADPLERAVVVLDPRPGHVASGAFPSGVQVVRTWPDAWLAAHPLREDDAVVVLSHDPRIDDAALRAVLPGPAGYVGALGSRATHAQRLARLRGTPGLARLVGPVGLDIGGVSPAETALSILAELVAVERGRVGRPLREGRSSIRPDLAGAR